MPTPVNDRLRVVAVIQALKTAGVRVKNWKNLMNGASQNNDDPVRKQRQSKFAFGRDLPLLPQCHVTDVGGTVPMFLVDACKFLSQHLHTEGLFRKTGSFSRIRQLRVGLEQGEPVFSLPHVATLQPCDVASVLKQFLRELPSPLIPVDLQGPLCQAQCLEEEGQEGGKDGTTLLLTALFPPSHSRALRYFCTFLRQTAQRCNENRMEVGNLALVISPNLLQYPAGMSKLTVGTERQLDRQAAVIKTLITNADRIGVTPSSILSMSTVEESGESTPPSAGEGFQERVGLGVYRSLRRQRRRSVGEIFVDALRQLKTGRTTSAPSNPTDSQQNAKRSTPQSPIITKRKSTDDSIADVEGSAKKRRSIHDLREDKHPIRKQHFDSESSIGPECSHSSVLCAVEGSRVQEPCVTLSASEKKRNQKRHYKRSNRLMAQDDGAHQRRRSLRFFNWTSPNSSNSSIGTDTENWLIVDNILSDGMTEASGSEVDGPSSIPVILIDGPGRVIVGSEVEDDPDLLNYSFAENPSDFQNLHTAGLPSELEREGGECECPGAKLGNEMMDETKTRHYDYNSELWAQEQAQVKEDAGEMGLGRKQTKVDMSGQVSQKPRCPRRSISMPEVTLEQMISRDEKEKKEKEKGGMTGYGDEIGVDLWSRSSNVVEEARTMTSRDKGLGKEMNEGEELVQERLLEKKEEAIESGLAFKRTHARMSVADRLRRFNALAMLLRSPRAPPATPKPQLCDILHESQLVGGHRGAVRLRRQGARRFGRSISHDGVAGTPSGQSYARQQELIEIPSFGELEDHSPSKLIKPQSTLNASHQDERLETQHTQDPELQDGISQTMHHPETLSSNLEQSQESCDRKPNKSPPQSQEQPKESDLQDLLEMHLNICDAKQDPGKEDLTVLMQLDRPSQTTMDVIPQTIVPQQHQLRISEVKPIFPSPPAPPLSHVDTCTLNDIIPALTQKDSTSPSENSNTAYIDTNCSPFNFIEIDVGLSAMGGCPLSVVLSPPGLQFRPPGTRRRYRDSPRWPIHEISVVTGDPLQV